MSFATAVDDSKKLLAKPTNEELLELYALYKVGNGEDFSSATAPGTFDFKGKAKYKAWKEVVDKGTSKEDAQTQYVTLVEKLKGAYGYDANKVAEPVGGS